MSTGTITWALTILVEFSPRELDVLDHDLFRTRVCKEDDDPLGICHGTDDLAEVDVKGECAPESWG